MNARTRDTTIFEGRWRIVARAVWIALAVGYFAIWLVSVPEYYVRVSTLTIAPFRLGERVIYANADALDDASQRGVSLETSAALDIGIDLLQILVYYITAALIFWRATNAFGWFTTFVLLLMGVGTNMARAVAVAAPFPSALFLIEIPAYLIWPLWLLWLYLFPNGRAVPRWSRLLVMVMFLLFLLLQVSSLLAAFGILPSQIDTFPATLGPAAALPLFGFILFAQIYRYGKVSNATERQQTKWFLFGVGMFFATLLLFVLIPDSFRNSILAQDLLALVFLIFPISVALAVLRYRLFDIDIIIRKTVTYTLVVALLAIVYFGSVILLQQIFANLTGQRSEVITVLSTLAIAVLFVPLRNRIQNAIDKRFYRKKYDAQKVLQKFSEPVRDETDLDKLTAELVNVVQVTTTCQHPPRASQALWVLTRRMQPKSVSVWLKRGDEETGRQGNKK